MAKPNMELLMPNSMQLREAGLNADGSVLHVDFSEEAHRKKYNDCTCTHACMHLGTVRDRQDTRHAYTAEMCMQICFQDMPSGLQVSPTVEPAILFMLAAAPA